MPSIFIVGAVHFAVPGQYDQFRYCVWGWYRNQVDAVKAVKENHTDLFERGWYSHAVISEIPEGLCGIAENSIWFSASFTDDGDFLKVKRVRQPEQAEGIAWGLA